MQFLILGLSPLAQTSLFYTFVKHLFLLLPEFLLNSYMIYFPIFVIFVFKLFLQLNRIRCVFIVSLICMLIRGWLSDTSLYAFKYVFI